ncbi:MAG TPA: DUF4395 domain-containing protein [Chloroflexia bacterium]|nr:DUF4395 domain-containing protein [Chloroflexia bacterium]
MIISSEEQTGVCLDIPKPIVTLNRSILFGGVVLALIFQQPLITTLLFAILLPATLFGQKVSLIFQLGKRILAAQCVGAELEDRRLQRFNNSIATILLGAAQLAFVAGVPLLGWIFAGMVAVAAGVALAGFCVGCFLYFQFNMQRYRLFGNR